ncbi:hypothetical protein V6N13_126198 [Hibiscus sabdariffa]|uniref:Protein kinase domain-containing protein n=2 Tax=Hibiscus sabdariffa TaxID=183260 RepID=A0ABR2AQN9_9ROSI
MRKACKNRFFEDGQLSWNWQTKFDIVFDVAKAFEFLHFSCDPLVIDGDIKPDNVLPDSDYRAKISDFGLLRIKVKGEFGVNLFYQDLTSQSLNLELTFAENLRLPYLSAYLDSIDTNFWHGANFVTGGSTIQPLDARMSKIGHSPISLDIQLVAI